MHKRFFSLALTLVVGLLVVSSAFGQTKAKKFRRVLNAIPGQYIVVFNDQMARSEVAASAHSLAGAHRGNVKFVYEDALKGFAVQLPEAAAIALSKNPQVDYVEEDTLNTISQTQFLSPGPNEFYGIDRIDQRNLPLNNIYSYLGGCCVPNVFILDTGLPYITNSQWQGSLAFNPPPIRIHMAYDTYGGSGYDGNNHGSAVASIIGGTTFGVAKYAELFTVKVCNDNGDCPSSNSIAGLNWVIANHQSTAVVNMSYGGAPSTSHDTAVRNAMASNLVVVLAAGNDNDNVAGHSPARVIEALTVGATLNNDARASYSNFGGGVDLYAPGGSVASSQGIPTVASGGGAYPFDGTSAAAPHAAGVAALYLSFNPGASSYVAAGELKKGSTWNKVTNLPFAGPDNLLYSLFPMSVSHFGGSIPFYRYYNGVLGDHFYTTNWNELGPRNYGWDFEFVGCYIFGTQVSNTVPLYQYYNGGTGDHFYTINFSTLGNGAYGYVYEKVAGYVYPNNANGGAPLYRYYNAQINDHFYTTDFNELGNGIKGYVYETIECYVSP